MKIELNKKQKTHLYELAVILYQEKGQEATEKLGELFDLEMAYCEPCNSIEPIMDHSCFICGSLIE